ncbi:MAG: hypothetical protein JF614_25765 [Acidobacteria bacterium]|jgi:hypothetical protein|nr:hypothetical protein [Acidobacteriota bacterium]
MRKKMMMLLAVSAVALAGLLSAPHAEANHSCPICTTYADGSQCCVSCICDDSGRRIACTDHFCPPAGGRG